jgi:hypothetical protein
MPASTTSPRAALFAAAALFLACVSAPSLAQSSGSSRLGAVPENENPGLLGGTVTATGVQLNAGADCTNASLDISLTSVGASREFGLATNLAGDILDEFEQGTGLANFDGTFVDYGISVTPTQPDNTLIGSYAYVGNTPPDAATTGEFFVYYNCTTAEVLLSCFGPFGTCPQTAQEADSALGVTPLPEPRAVPSLALWGLGLLVLLMGSLGVVAVTRRQ